MFLTIEAVNKDIQSKRTFSRQSFPYFETFCAITEFSFHLSFHQIFIITYKHGIYELPHELHRILGNEEISGKCLNSKA